MFFNAVVVPVFRMLRKDKEEVEAIKNAKALEAEKAMYSVRCHTDNVLLFSATKYLHALSTT